MTEPVQLTLEIPDLDTAPDEVIQSLRRTRDGRWSGQTKAILAKAGSEQLTLNDAWASTPMSWLAERGRPVIVGHHAVLICHDCRMSSLKPSAVRRACPTPASPWRTCVLW